MSQTGMEVSASVERTSTLAPAADERWLGAWCEWLGALATDAEAALATAIAYRELTPSGRDYWLAVLEQDAKQLDVPKIALYAPLLAVESDAVRRQRISQAMGPTEAQATSRFESWGLSGVALDGTRVAVLCMPLYLEFAQVIACGYRLDSGFSWTRHDPIVDRASVPKAGDRLQGVPLESAPLKSLIDDLAHAVLAQRRNGRELPEALTMFADLFGPLVTQSSPPPQP